MSLLGLGKCCIEKSKCTRWSAATLYSFARIYRRPREKRNLFSRSIVSTTAYRRRYGTPCLVSRLEIVPRGQKTHEGAGGRGGAKWKTRGEAYRTEGQDGLERRKKRETRIIVGKDGAVDAVIWRCMHHRLCHLTREDRPT